VVRLRVGKDKKRDGEAERVNKGTLAKGGDSQGGFEVGYGKKHLEKSLKNCTFSGACSGG